MRDDPGRCPQASEEENRAKDEQRTRKLQRQDENCDADRELEPTENEHRQSFDDRALRQRKRKDEHAEITEQDLDLAFHHLPGDLALLDALALLGHRQHCEDVGVFGGVEHAGDQQRRGRDIDDGRNVVLKRLAGDPPLQDQRERDEEGGIDDDEDEIQAKIGAQEPRALDEQGRVVGGRRVNLKQSLRPLGGKRQRKRRAGQ
jgi:hypothetical protein